MMLNTIKFIIKKVLPYLLMMALISIAFYLDYFLAKEDDNFEKSNANCIIVRKEPADNGLIYTYFCDDGHKFHERLVYSLNNEDINSGIKEGDSISKKSNDPTFVVYRKNPKGKYNFYGKFKIY